MIGKALIYSFSTQNQPAPSYFLENRAAFIPSPSRLHNIAQASKTQISQECSGGGVAGAGAADSS